MSPKTKHMQMSENVAQRHFCVDDGGVGGGGGGGFTFGRLGKKKVSSHHHSAPVVTSFGNILICSFLIAVSQMIRNV